MKTKQIRTIALKRGDFKEKADKYEGVSKLFLWGNHRYPLTRKTDAVS